MNKYLYQRIAVGQVTKAWYFQDGYCLFVVVVVMATSSWCAAAVASCTGSGLSLLWLGSTTVSIGSAQTSKSSGHGSPQPPGKPSFAEKRRNWRQHFSNFERMTTNSRRWIKSKNEYCSSHGPGQPIFKLFSLFSIKKCLNIVHSSEVRCWNLDWNVGSFDRWHG